VRAALKGVADAYESAPGMANPEPTTELVSQMYRAALRGLSNNAK
jgi:hypothetical protein